MSVAEVSAPHRASSAMARLTPGVRPKSSAFTISRFTWRVYQAVPVERYFSPEANRWYDGEGLIFADAGG